MDINKLYELLKKSWSVETCSSSLKEKWSKENPALGQSAVTSIIVNYFFDGKIMKCMSETGEHYYNIINGKVVDLTVGQFNGNLPEYKKGEESSTKILFSNEDTKKRYIALNNNVYNVIQAEKIGRAMRFYLLATKLKYKIRSGWDNTHWNINCERRESIAEHVYGTCILAISLNSEYDLNLDMEKILKMLTIHEIGEVEIGDYTPFDGKTIEEKAEIEHKAMQDVLGDLIGKEELYSLLLEFDKHESEEAKFAYLCDKMEADIQAKIYQDMGYQRSLDDQDNNIAFNNPNVQYILNNGAKTAFDVWYEYDKGKYIGEPIFVKTLKYIKDNNTNI